MNTDRVIPYPGESNFQYKSLDMELLYSTYIDPWGHKDNAFTIQLYTFCLEQVLRVLENDSRIIFIDIGSGEGHSAVPLRSCYPSIYWIMADISHTALSRNVVADVKLVLDLEDRQSVDRFFEQIQIRSISKLDYKLLFNFAEMIYHLGGDDRPYWRDSLSYFYERIPKGSYISVSDSAIRYQYRDFFKGKAVLLYEATDYSLSMKCADGRKVYGKHRIHYKS